jgi:hypothetical protein
MIETSMKRMIFTIPIVALFSILMLGCRKDSSIDTSLFTVEEIDGVKYVHNLVPQMGDTPGAELELIGQIGKLEAEEEKDLLYDPVDAVRLPNGDILILEREGSTVKRYDKNHEFVSSFGQKGQGPGDFIYPFCLRLSSERDKLIVAGSKISILTLDGSYEGGFKPERIGGSSIHENYRTSGMAVLSGPQVILSSPPSMWLDSGDPNLLSIYDRTGSVIRSFGYVKRYDNPELTLLANVVFFATDKKDIVYIAYSHQNRISKYSPDGQWIFSADRSLPYEVKNEVKVEIFKSGEMEREFAWPSGSSVSKGISIDQKNRIWVLTFLKQPNRFLTFDEDEDLTDCYEFDVFDPDGILLFQVPFPDVRFDNFSICDDRMYLVDSQDESCVYEYRIVENR